MRYLLFLSLALVGCGSISSQCTSQLSVCGERAAMCLASSGCDVSACFAAAKLQQPTSNMHYTAPFVNP